MKPKRWQDVILQQFGHEQNQSVVVVDPDRLMQDGVLISELQARRYDILNFTSEIGFRNEFEERYRSHWDQGEKMHIVVIVHSSEASRLMPYDLERKSRVVEIGLHQVFPRLNRIVLDDLDRRYYPIFLPDRLYPVYPPADGLFASEKSAGISHGGLSVEEMIIYFLKFSGVFWVVEKRMGLDRMILKHTRIESLEEALLNHLNCPPPCQGI